MIDRVPELCRKLKPVLGAKIDRLYRAYLAGDADDRADLEQTLELLAAKHLHQTYEPDRAPFPPPAREFAQAGDIPMGNIWYGGQSLHSFSLQSCRLKEHLLVCGRSGSGKTNLTFVLMLGMMRRGIKVLALDWKRGYRDLLSQQKDLRVYTIGRDVSPFRFNPLIPPTGCETNVWIKLITDVIASSYLGGEGVISLLVAGLDHLYQQFGVTDGHPTRWPTIQDLLVWLKTVKLRGRAAMWQASAERILLAMTYGEFSSVVNCQSNRQVEDLLNANVVLEMDGLSSSSDRVMFSESLTLYLYRYRLAQGPQEELTNVIVLEEAHNLLLAKQTGAKESMLETSIRMIRQYGLGYVFVDQSASMLSKVAFANSYATLALSQKLSADVRTMAGAMNLTDEQKDALSTLPIGTAVVRLADQHPEPFLVKIPRSPIREGTVSDTEIRRKMATYYTESSIQSAPRVSPLAVSPIPHPDRSTFNNHQPAHPSTPPLLNPHPPPLSPVSSAEESAMQTQRFSPSSDSFTPGIHPTPKLTREAVRFLADVAARPLSTTVARYQRLNLSRRRGNAIRQQLASAAVIEAVALATRWGQVVLYELTDHGRVLCEAAGIDPGPRPRASLEHRFWVMKAAEHFEKAGYVIGHEHVIDGNGAVDLVAQRPGERLAVEVETGKSDIMANLEKVHAAGFDRIILLATSPTAMAACQKAIDAAKTPSVELRSWLDFG
jgi:hypothetical protein